MYILVGEVYYGTNSLHAMAYVLLFLGSRNYSEANFNKAKVTIILLKNE